MARVRTIKPEFWSSAQVMECSPNARLFFIGLWNFCDDHGNHPASEKQLKALVFPGDEFSLATIRGMVDELASNGLLLRYSHENKEYLHVTGWVHQKIDKPQRPKFPPPTPQTIKAVVERSQNGIDGAHSSEHITHSPEQRPPLAEQSTNGDGDDEYERVRLACSKALGPAAPGSAVIGPIVTLVRQGMALSTIVDVLRSERERPRPPVKTWALWATIIAEKISANPKLTAANGFTAEKTYDLGTGAPIPEANLIRQIKSPAPAWRNQFFSTDADFRDAVRRKAPHLMPLFDGAPEPAAQPP